MVLLKRSRAPVFKADRPFLFLLRQINTGIQYDTSSHDLLLSALYAANTRLAHHLVQKGARFLHPKKRAGCNPPPFNNYNEENKEQRRNAVVAVKSVSSHRLGRTTHAASYVKGILLDTFQFSESHFNKELNAVRTSRHYLL